MEREILEQEIEIRTESIIPFPKDNYYTKTEVDDLLDDKADEETVSEIIIDVSNIEDEQILQNESISTLNNSVTSINGDIQGIRTDMGNLSLITETGSQIALNISTSDYKMTATLKDKNGNTIYTSNEIDLPLESVVVNGRYDSTNKKIILTLQNGTEIEFSVADLVSGLQSEITVNNKLSSDLVDDTNNTNKFVTTSEKTTWNNKQDELVSGTNIKSINNNSILGSGNLDLGGESRVLGDYTEFNTSNNAINIDDLDLGLYLISNKDGNSANNIIIYVKYTYNNQVLTTPITPSFSSSFSLVEGYFPLFIINKAQSGNFKICQARFLGYDSTNKDLKIAVISTRINNGEMNSTGSIENMNMVLRTGNQTISGVKTFNTLPESSVTPTSNNQFVNKSYVDSNSIRKVTSNSNIWELDSGIYIVDESIELTYNLRNFRFTTPATKLMMYVGSDEGVSPNIRKMFYLIGRPVDISTGVYPEIIVGSATNDYYGVMNKYNIEKFMNIDGIQYISGTKYFNTLPESSITPTTNNQLVNKSYVDSAISSAIGTALGGSY